MNIKTKTLKLVLIIYFACSNFISFSQNSLFDAHTDLLKYWYYRNRLKYFVIPGDRYGESEIVSIRNRHLDQNIDFGQHSCYSGYYLGMLATEIKLLINNGNYDAAQIVTNELIEAVNQYIKYMDECEHVWCLDDKFNGYFIRTNVPWQFLDTTDETYGYSWNNNIKGPSHLCIFNQSLAASNVWSYNTYTFGNLPRGHPGTILEGSKYILNSVNPDATYCNHQEGLPENMSKDEAIGLILGFALIYKFVPEGNEILYETNANLKQSASIISTKIIDYLHNGEIGQNGDWCMNDPNGQFIPFGNCQSYSYGLAKTACFFGNRDLTDYFKRDVDRDAARIIWNNLQNEMPGISESVYDGVMESTIAAIGDSWAVQIWELPPIWGDNDTYDCIHLKMRSNGIDPFYLLLYCLLHDLYVLDDVTKDKIYDMLDDAPGEGPYYYSMNHYANCGWAYSYKWHGYATEQWGINTSTDGNFNGLDYMLLYNMMALYRSENDGNYHSYQEWEMTGNLPVFVSDGIIIGDNNNPSSISAFEDLNSSAHILNTTRYSYAQKPIDPLPFSANVTFCSPQEIVLEPGFLVEKGAFFCTKIKQIFWDDFKQGAIEDTSCKISIDPYSLISNNSKNDYKEKELNYDNNIMPFGTNIDKIKIFPNPVSDYLTIEILRDLSDRLIYQIFDIEKTNILIQGELKLKEEKINLKSLLPGIYFIKIQNSKLLLMNKIVKI